MVREGAARAEVVAEFDSPSELQAWLAEQELEGDPGSCLLRRTLEAGGRSRAFINGRPVTLQQLKEAGEWLVDIHGQHAHYSLLKPALQRQILDRYAGAEKTARDVAQAYKAWLEAAERRRQAELQVQERQAERDRLVWVVEELAALRFSLDEWQALQESHQRLAHAAELLSGAQQVNAALAEDEAGILALLKAAQHRLAGLAEIDPKLAEPLKLLDSGLIELTEAAHELTRYSDRLELDPAALAQAEARIAAVTSAAHKFRVKPAELPELLARSQAQLAELEQLTDPAALAEAERVAEAAWRQAAAALSRLRQAGAEKLARAVTQAMQGLAMKGGRFAVVLQDCAPGVHGQEEIEFQVSPHSGQGLNALAKTASGGELSRIGLSLQTVLSGVSGTPSLIFDEVDAGIGGGVAEILGRMLAALGAGRQVLCVTHLPQVAACAGSHYSVSKAKKAGTVVSQVRQLKPAERVDEVARMLGGVTITETTRRHAEEMLGG
jgi:DNA repair protein RecN (Recombination protein N)